MYDNKNTLRLVLAVAIAFGILGGGLWVLSRFFTQTFYPGIPDTNLFGSPDERMSFGEKILVKKELFADKQAFQTAKEQGVKAMANRNYQSAAQLFEKALEIAPNAPETRIYMSNAQIGDAEAYTIAVTVPIIPQKNGNEHPAQALEMLRGFAHAQDEINNSGGINNKRIKLQIIDDDDNPDIATKIAEKLVKDKKVIGVMGHRLSEVSVAVAPIYANGNLVFITPVSTSSQLNLDNIAVNKSSNRRYVFRTNIDTKVASQKLASYVYNNLQEKQVAIFYDSQKPQYSERLRRGFKESFVDGFQGQIVYEADLSSGSDNFYPAVEKIQEATNKGAKVFLLLPNLNSIENALSIISEIPKNPNPSQRIHLIGDISNLYRTSTLSRREQAAGMVLAVASHMTNQDPFYQQALKLWGGDDIGLAWQTATSYDATQIFIEALKRNPNPENIQENIQEEICKNDFQAKGASGEFLKFDCDRSSTPINKVRLVQVSPPDAASPSKYYFKLLPY